jgi:hypothetical protein
MRAVTARSEIRFGFLRQVWLLTNVNNAASSLGAVLSEGDRFPDSLGHAAFSGYKE